jgi:protein SCO1
MSSSISRFTRHALACLFIFSPTATLLAQDSLRSAPEILAPISGAEIVEKLGESIQIDQIWLIDEKGDSSRLRDLLLPGKPAILNMGYFDCPKLCGLVTNALLSGMQQTAWTPGKEYQVLTISLDPNETHGLAADKKANYLAKFDRPGAEDGWRFLTGTASNVAALSEATGFGFVWDEKSEQYMHAAAVVVISPEGTITRYLYGVSYPEIQLRNALYEAADGKVGTTIDKLVLYCFDYDPLSNSYVLVAVNIMKLGGLVTMLGLGIFLGLFWLRERRSKRTSQSFT